MGLQILWFTWSYLTRKQSSKLFLFNRLPIIVKNEVIRSMRHKDCLNLAITSKRMEKAVKLARIKASNMTITISPTAHLTIWDWKLTMFYDKDWTNFKNSTIIKPIKMKPWLNDKSSSIVEKAAKLHAKIDNIFLFKQKFGLTFDYGYQKHTTIKEVLSNQTLRTWNCCAVYGETIDPDDLKMILDMATPERSFSSFVKEMPVGFRHDNALKFRNNDYHDAGWARIEDLYGLQNCENVSLGRTSFTQEQVKAFINFWVNCEIDMFWWLRIDTTESLDISNMLDGLLVLYHRDPDCDIVLTLSKSSSKKRKKTLLSINPGKSGVVLSAWGADEHFVAVNDEEEANEKFKNCREILELLYKKKELEEQFVQAADQDRSGMQSETNDIVDKLAALNVYFENGTAILP